MSTPTLTPAAPPRRRNRRWLIALLLGLVAVLAPVVAWTYRHWSGEREVQELLAELDRTDPGWRFAEIQARRKPIPDEQNSALQILNVLRVYGKRHFEIS